VVHLSRKCFLCDDTAKRLAYWLVAALDEANRAAPATGDAIESCSDADPCEQRPGTHEKGLTSATRSAARATAKVSATADSLPLLTRTATSPPMRALL
jgi:hypothetical protein